MSVIWLDFYKFVDCKFNIYLAGFAMKGFFVIVVYQLIAFPLYNCGLFVPNYQGLGNFAFLLYIFLLCPN
jgi:hypothetical protein